MSIPDELSVVRVSQSRAVRPACPLPLKLHVLVHSALKTANLGNAATTLAPQCATKTTTSSPMVPVLDVLARAS
jgi:hypothetical protein